MTETPPLRTVKSLRSRRGRLQSCSHRWQKSCNDRCHRILIFGTNSANGRLQSAPVSGQENRDGQVWVEHGPSLAGAERRLLEGVCQAPLHSDVQCFSGLSPPRVVVVTWSWLGPNRDFDAPRRNAQGAGDPPFCFLDGEGLYLIDMHQYPALRVRAQYSLCVLDTAVWSDFYVSNGLRG